MWVVGGTYLLFVFSAVFFAWANAEGVHDDVATPVRRLRPRPAAQTPQPSEQPSVDAPEAAPVASSARRVVGSPTDLGARHVVTSAPDRSRLN